MDFSDIEVSIYRVCNENNIPYPDEIKVNKKLKKAIARCNKKSTGNYSIEICENLLNAPIEEIDDTIRHEIAHGISPYGARHGNAWKLNAIKLGARPNRCSQIPINYPTHMYICPKCLAYAMRYNNVKNNFQCTICREHTIQYDWEY